MSVKIGRIIDGLKTYVVGAPRSTEVGQVLLLQPEAQYLVIKLTLDGEQFGSGFGYDIALGDFNNDKSVASRFFRRRLKLNESETKQSQNFFCFSRNKRLRNKTLRRRNVSAVLVNHSRYQC